MKGKERVPVPVAGPAFRGGVKFIMFYMFSSFLQPAPKVGSTQCPLSPVCYARLRKQVHRSTNHNMNTSTKSQKVKMETSNVKLYKGFKLETTEKMKQCL